jgi:hypothetical protein
VAPICGGDFFSTLLVVAGVLRRRRITVWPLLMQFVIVAITAAVFYGFFRFRIPEEVAIVVLAAGALDAPFERQATRCPNAADALMTLGAPTSPINR